MKKKLFNLICLFSTVLVTFTLSSCGGGDDDGGGNAPYRVVDGVNVPTGKKLTSLSVYEKYYTIEYTYNYKVEYDEKGRLTNIYMTYGSEKYLLASIDYNTRSVSYGMPYNSKETYSFSLNSDGYISRLGTCVLNYDNHGYLNNVRDLYDLSVLTYNTGDIIQTLVTPLTSQDTYRLTYTAAYENTTSSSNFKLYVNTNKRDMGTLNNDVADAVVLIAYQSGLFGKISSAITSLKQMDNVDAKIIYKEVDYPANTYNAHFEFE